MREDRDLVRGSWRRVLSNFTLGAQKEQPVRRSDGQTNQSDATNPDSEASRRSRAFTNSLRLPPSTTTPSPRPSRALNRPRSPPFVTMESDKLLSGSRESHGAIEKGKAVEEHDATSHGRFPLFAMQGSRGSR